MPVVVEQTVVIVMFVVAATFVVSIWAILLYHMVREGGAIRTLRNFLLGAVGLVALFFMTRSGVVRSGGFFLFVSTLLVVIWGWAFYHLVGPGSVVRASPYRAERSCDALYYRGKLRPSRLVTLVVTPDSVTAYTRFYRDKAYERGQRGLADATGYGFRVYASHIWDVRSDGIGMRITDFQGDWVRLYGRGVRAALSILGSGPAPPRSGFPYPPPGLRPGG